MDKKRLRAAVLISALSALIAVAAIGIMYFGAENSGKTKVNVRLKWLHQAQFAGFYVADKQGYYRAAGMDVALNPGGVDFPAIQMVSGGAEQFGVAGADQILLAREKGVPVVAIAVLYRKSPFELFSLASSKIKRPQDFSGRKVGVKLGGNEELAYRAMVRKLGIDPACITEVPVKYDMTPLFTGQVDVWPGYAINEAIVSREQGHPVNEINPADYGVNLYADTIFTTEDILRSKPGLVSRFLSATLKGWREALEHPEEAAEETLLYGDKLTKPHELAMMKASIPFVKPDARPVGWMDRKQWSDMQALLLGQGFMKKPVDVDAVFTTKFLKDIYGIQP